VSSFQGANNTYLYGVGSWSCVLIREVSSIQGCPLRGVPLIHCSMNFELFMLLLQTQLPSYTWYPHWCRFKSLLCVAVHLPHSTVKIKKHQWWLKTIILWVYDQKAQNSTLWVMTKTLLLDKQWYSKWGQVLFPYKEIKDVKHIQRRRGDIKLAVRRVYCTTGRTQPSNVAKWCPVHWQGKWREDLLPWMHWENRGLQRIGGKLQAPSLACSLITGLLKLSQRE